MAKKCPRARGRVGINSETPREPARSSADPAEERKLPAAAERKLPRRQTNRLLAGAGLRAFDRDIGKTAFAALERGDHGRVAAVDVLPDGELAGFVDKRRLIGEMHRDEGLEADVLLAAADHPLQPLLRIAVM